MSTDYCPAEGQRLHETFGCLEPAGHAGLHRAGVYHDPCPNCGSVEEHTEECPTPDLMEDKSTPLTQAVWDKGSTKVRLEPRDPKTSRCPHCHGTGRIRG